jgi:gluconolactonase
MNYSSLASAAGLLGLLATAAVMAGDAPPPEGQPLAVIDLGTREGVALVKGEWRYRDADIVNVEFRAAGPDGQPTGAPVKTHDITPHAGGRDFDDRAWQVIAPETLTVRRGSGRLSFDWYRIRVTVPERIDGVDPSGSTAVFETSVDDYAEVWVDGELPRAAGQSGGSVVKGWNAVNRLVIGRDVQPGQTIQLAVFGANGPLSNPPTNYIWMRTARLAFYAGGTGPYAVEPQEVNVEVERLDPAIDDLVPPNAKVFKLASGFQFTEGPVWVDEAGGVLLFSDPNANTIYRYTHDGRLSVFRHPSGYAGRDIAEYHQPGSNGLTLDAQGRLTIDQHGNRRVIRLEPDGRESVLADRYRGQRLNSPNDLVYKSDGSLYFTDPPFGLPKFDQDPRRELPFSGVFRVKDGVVELLTRELKGPNGIAISPDERYLYVGDWDEKHKVVMRYPVRPDGRLGAGEVFYDMTMAPGEDAIDGIKVDVEGNLYVSGPGGLWILSPEGRHLGTVYPPRHVHNMAWGDADGRTLYLCAGSTLYRMPLKVAGVRPPGATVR